MWWVALAGVSLAYWGAQLVLALRCARHVPPVAGLPDEAPSRWPVVSVVVPACDEQHAIAAALASKLGCGYQNLEVIAVDDRSHDQTGAIMDAAASSDARLHVVHVSALPDGWLGKLHAMERGLDAAAGEWLLFSDADVMIEPSALARLVAHAEANGLDFVAVMPGLDRSTLLLDALLVNFMRSICMLGRMWRANDDGSSIGVGVGAFNLVRRAALDKTPGLAWLRLEVADDVALGAMLKACGARCRLFAGRRDVHLAFYSDWAGAAHSWEKFGTVFEFTLWRPLLFVTLQLGLELVLPLFALAMGGAAAWVGALALVGATLTHAVLAWHLALVWRGVVLWPLGSLAFALLTVRAAFVTWRDRGIRWRTTFYAADELLAGRRFYAGSIDVGAARAAPPR